MINVEEKKRAIISYLKNVGPSLPIRIAKAINMEPVFASAILSELLGSKSVKTSYLRVGSSPLYLLEGQEKELENFIDNLNSVEKEAFLKLKSSIVLPDKDQTPAIRVALSGLKDFAISFELEDQKFWRYAFASEEEVNLALRKIKGIKLGDSGEKKEEPTKEENKLESKTEPSEEPKKVKEEKQLQLKKETKKVKEEPELNSLSKDTISIKEEYKNSDFYNSIKDYLSSKGISLVKEIQIDKKEFVGIISIKNNFEDNCYALLIAKDKKSVSLEEINFSLQRAIHEKMPCFYLIRKEPPKKIKDFLASNYLIRVFSF